MNESCAPWNRAPGAPRSAASRLALRPCPRADDEERRSDRMNNAGAHLDDETPLLAFSLFGALPFSGGVQSAGFGFATVSGHWSP